MAKTKQPKYEEWELENKADTVMQAEEIKANKPLMKQIKPIINRKIEGAETVKKAVFPYKK